jgi:opacity protein-like surface antigen
MKTTPRIITALAIAGAFVTTAVQAAETGPYFRVDAGPVFVRDIPVNSLLGTNVSGVKIETKAGIGFAAAGGFKLNENFALELESGLQWADFKSLNFGGVKVPVSGSGSVVPVLANGVFTAKLSESVSAHIGAGVGLAITSVELGVGGATASDTEASFMGQLKSGLDFKLSDNVAAGFGYHFGYVDGPDFSGIKAGKILTHMFTAGVGFKF